MPQPLISIVIPVLNRREIVGRTLESVRSQTVRPLSVILVDNGSVDGTFEMLNHWAADNDSDCFKIRVVRTADEGACQARNAGLKYVETPWVAFFDSDDVMLPDHIRRITDEISKHQEAEIIYFDIAFIDPDGWMEVKSINDNNIMRAHLLHGALSTCRFVARIELVRRVGGWCEHCPRWNDLELGVRLLMENPATRKLTGEPTVHQYHTDVSITGNGYYDPEHRCETSLDIIYGLLSTAMLTTEKQWVESRRAILAAWYSREGHHADATRLMQGVLARAASLGEALRYRCIYLATRLFGHGGTFLAARFFSKKDAPEPLKEGASE